MSSVTQRQLLVWGEEKLEVLRNSHVIVAGVGGLGCVVAEQLARAGIGSLSLIDNGLVDLPDLGRQVLYIASDLGESKVFVAAERLRLMAPGIEINAHCQRIEDFSPGIEEYLKNFHAKYTGFADCLDNYKGRFVFESCIPEGRFLVHGGIEEERGQITTLVSGNSTSLRNIFSGAEQPPSPIAIIPQCCAIAGSFQSLVILHNLWHEAGIKVSRKNTLRGIMMFLDIAEGSLEYMELS